MRASLLLLAALGSAFVVGCGGHRSGPDTEGLDSESAALIEDNADVEGTEEEVELGVEESLSGGEPTEVAALEPADIAEKARLNPGIFFKPAGCIVSTREANVVTHVFTNCTGPHGMVSFNGTVKSTWTKLPNGAQVVHTSTGFKINGATVDHNATIQYTRVDGVFTKTRKGSLSGTTAKGRTIKHSADYVSTYDSSKSEPSSGSSERCVTRNGTSSTTVGLRAWSRTIKGFERCGIGLGGCPNSGTITLDTPRRDVSLSFPGGAAVDITIDGKKFRRPLFCNAAAS